MFFIIFFMIKKYMQIKAIAGCWDEEVKIKTRLLNYILHENICKNSSVYLE